MLSSLNWDFWQYLIIAGILAIVIVLCTKYICYTIIIVKNMKRTGKSIKEIHEDLDAASKVGEKTTQKKTTAKKTTAKKTTTKKSTTKKTGTTRKTKTDSKSKE